MQMLLVFQTPGEPVSRKTSCRDPLAPLESHLCRRANDNVVDSAAQAPWLCTSCCTASSCIAGLLTVARRLPARNSTHFQVATARPCHADMRVTAWRSCPRERQRSIFDSHALCRHLRAGKHDEPRHVTDRPFHRSPPRSRPPKMKYARASPESAPTMTETLSMMACHESGLGSSIALTPGCPAPRRS